MELYIECPCCNKLICLVLNGSVLEVKDASFNISQDILKEKIKSLGYEFGKKGGE